MAKALHMYPDKCTSCLMCEMACSLENEGLFNPAKSRIKVFEFEHGKTSVPYTCTQCEEAHAVTGMIHLYNGDPFKALEPLETAKLLDPYYRDAYQHIQAQAYFHLREYTKAEQLLCQRLMRKPDSDTSRVLLAATYGHLGNIKKATENWSQTQAINPDYSIDHKRSILPYRNPESFEQIIEGLQLAGITSHR